MPLLQAAVLQLLSGPALLRAAAAARRVAERSAEDLRDAEAASALTASEAHRRHVCTAIHLLSLPIQATYISAAA